jgi:Domain of unknown function (DUF4440)
MPAACGSGHTGIRPHDHNSHNRRRKLWRPPPRGGTCSPWSEGTGKRWDKDIDAAVELTDDPCIITGAQGVGLVDRQTYETMMKNATWDILDVEIGDDPQVRVLADDAAILAYTVHERLTVDGEPVTIDAADASTWVRRDGNWRCALHTESIAGDPFGRDRTRS